jgi:hypothetical protein
MTGQRLAEPGRRLARRIGRQAANVLIAKFASRGARLACELRQSQGDMSRIDLRA